jgi:hypothetical protein
LLMEHTLQESVETSSSKAAISLTKETT